MTRYADAAAYVLRGAGRPDLVVALHGLTGSSGGPLALLEGLDSPELGVLAPDLRAHGDTRFTGHAADFTPTHLAADVEELVDHLGLRPARVRLMGISLGATVALELLRRGVLPVDAAVFVRPSHGATSPEHLRVNLAIARMLRDDPSTAFDRLATTDAYREVASVSARAAEGLRAKVTKPRSAELVMRLEQGNWTAFRDEERVATDVPTLVVSARRDPLHPIAVAESWHRRVVGSKLGVLPPYDDGPGAHTSAARSLVQGFLLRPKDAA